MAENHGLRSVGQHGEGDVGYIITHTKPAMRDEYLDLLRELEMLGYKVKVGRRFSYKRLWR